MVILSLNHTSSPSTAATFSQHVSWQWCIYSGILSPITEILLIDSVFYSRVTPISILILKPPLGIIGAILLKP